MEKYRLFIFTVLVNSCTYLSLYVMHCTLGLLCCREGIHPKSPTISTSWNSVCVSRPVSVGRSDQFFPQKQSCHLLHFFLKRFSHQRCDQFNCYVNFTWSVQNSYLLRKQSHQFVTNNSEGFVITDIYFSINFHFYIVGNFENIARKIPIEYK